MTAITLHHVQVLCPAGGEDSARRFYGKWLGLRELPKPASLASDGVWFALDDHRQLHVGVLRAGDEPTRNRSHLALRVHDLAAVLAILRREKIHWTTPAVVPGWTRAQIRDPFGNAIELLQIDAPSERGP